MLPGIYELGHMIIDKLDGNAKAASPTAYKHPQCSLCYLKSRMGGRQIKPRD